MRRQLQKGDTPTARSAARLLDTHGELQDVGLLRAFARTYRGRGRLTLLGNALAHRVSPRCEVRDLGRVSINIGGRTVELASMRRKPAALLMYLATRPGFTANREQVLEELWPDNDPSGASNSLNQSLYFLRREFDPWYEDDLSVDYVALQGDLVWLDPRLVRVESVDFLGAAQAALRDRLSGDDTVNLLGGYSGLFAPEFEYDDWAMSWRSRVHTAFLELSSRGFGQAIRAGDLATGRDIAVHALEVDPDNPELEEKLIWLYWHMGARAAATAQHQHLVARIQGDGLTPPDLETVVSAPEPT